MINRKVFRIALLALWMIVIFLFSSFNGETSNKQSDTIIYNVVDKTNPDKSQEEKEIIVKNNSYIVRKVAHFTEYFILGILIYRVLILFINRNVMMICLLFCLFYAGLDEFHQSFVSDRTPMIRDVCIDFIGSCISIFLYNLINRNIKK